MTERPRFENVGCSQCGRDFGPGEHGFSHCVNHPGWKRDRMLRRQESARKGWETRKQKQRAADFFLAAIDEREGHVSP